MIVPQDWGNAAARILLVDDEKPIRDLFCKILECDEYEVLSASNGPDALEICSRSFRPIQLLITDIQMPSMSGYELAEKCSSLFPALSVLFVSGSIPDKSMQATLNARNRAFLSKPLRPEVLQRRTRAMLAASAEDRLPGDAPHPARTRGGNQGDYVQGWWAQDERSCSEDH